MALPPFSAAPLGPLLKRQVAPVVSFTIGRKGSGVSSLNHLVDIEFGCRLTERMG